MTSCSSPAPASPVTAPDRLAILLELAAQLGILRIVSDDEAASWRSQWIKEQAHPSPGRACPASGPVVSPDVPRRRVPWRSVQVGAWMEVLTASGHIVGQVLGVVKPGQKVEAIIGQERMALLDRRCKAEWSRPLPRVALLLPAGLLSRPTIKLLYLGSVKAHARRLDGPPGPAPSRLVAPIPSGSRVAWKWHSRRGECAYIGSVQAFVPAFASLASLGWRLGGGTHDVSRQDRYVVQLSGKTRLVAPPAYVLEAVVAAR